MVIESRNNLKIRHLLLLTSLILLFTGCQKDVNQTDYLSIRANILKCEVERWKGKNNFLAKVLNNKNYPVEIRIRAALAMGRIGNPCFLGSLLSNINDQYVIIRSMCCFAIGEIIDHENRKMYRFSPPELLFSSLREKLNDPSERVRARAIEAIGKSALAKSLPNIERFAPDSKTQWENTKILYAREWCKAVFRLKSTKCIPELLKLCKTPASYYALKSLARVARISRKNIDIPTQTISTLMWDRSIQVRAAACEVAPMLKKPPATSLIIRLLKDRSLSVRIAAIRALGHIGNKNLAKASLIEYGNMLLTRLFGVHQSNSDYMFNELMAIVDSLSILGGDDSISTLMSWAKKDLRLAPYCIYALCQRNPIKWPFALVKPTPIDQATAMVWINALCTCKDPRAIDFLKKLNSCKLLEGWKKKWLLASRPLIINALLKNEGPNAGTSVFKLLKDSDPYVRAVALDWIRSKPANEKKPFLNAVIASTARHLKSFAPDALLSAIPILKECGEKGRKLLNVLAKSSFLPVRLAAAGALWDLGVKNAFSLAIPAPAKKLSFYKNIIKRFNRDILVNINTTKGIISLDLFRKQAPLTCENFIQLASSGYYDGVMFHRIVPDFVVQGGDPIGSGYGGPGYTIPCEINSIPFMSGTVGMALAGKDTGGSQFFITLSPQPHLDGGYTVFAKVISDMSTVDALVPGDKINSIDVIWEPEKEW